MINLLSFRLSLQDLLALLRTDQKSHRVLMAWKAFIMNRDWSTGWATIWHMPKKQTKKGHKCFDLFLFNFELDHSSVHRLELQEPCIHALSYIKQSVRRAFPFGAQNKRWTFATQPSVFGFSFDNLFDFDTVWCNTLPSLHFAGLQIVVWKLIDSGGSATQWKHLVAVLFMLETISWVHAPTMPPGFYSDKNVDYEQLFRISAMLSQ